MAVTIGPHTLSAAQLVPAKYKGKSAQTAAVAGDASVVVSGSNLTERFYYIRCKLPRVEIEKINAYIENSLRYRAETVTVTDGFNVSRIMRFWDDETNYSIGGGGYTEVELVFREEVNA